MSAPAAKQQAICVPPPTTAHKIALGCMGCAGCGISRHQAMRSAGGGDERRVEGTTEDQEPGDLESKSINQKSI